MPFRGPSVATFLMQAEENLAALGAQLEGPEQGKQGTPRAGALIVHQGPAGDVMSQKTPPRQTRDADARSSQLSDKPKRIETLQSLEEQLDIQARSLLGIDKRLRSLDSRLRQSVEAAGAIAEKHCRSLLQEVLHGPMREIDERVSELQATKFRQADAPESVGRREFQVLERKVAEVLLANKRAASASSRSASNVVVEQRLLEIEAALRDVGETSDSRRIAFVEQRLVGLEERQRSFFNSDASSENEVRLWMRGVDERIGNLEPARNEQDDVVERWEIGAMEERVLAEQTQASGEIVALQERLAELELSFSRLNTRGPATAMSIGVQDPAAGQSYTRQRVSSGASSSAEASAGAATSRNVGEHGPSVKTRSASASSIASGGLCGLSASMRGLGETCGATASSPGVVRMQVQRLNSQQGLSPAPFDTARLEDVELSSHEKKAVATAHASLNRLTNLLEADRSSGVPETFSSFEPPVSSNDRLCSTDDFAGAPNYPASRDLPLASPRHSPFQGYNDRTSLNTITEAQAVPTGDFVARSWPEKEPVGYARGNEGEGFAGAREEKRDFSAVPAPSSAGSLTMAGSTTAASTPAGPSLSASLSASTPAAEPFFDHPLAEVDQGADPTDLLDAFLEELSVPAPGPGSSSQTLPQPAFGAPTTAGLADICARLRATPPQPPPSDPDDSKPLVVAQATLSAVSRSSTSSSPTGSMSSLPM